MAGAAKQVHRDVRRRRAHPAQPGPMSLQTTEQLVSTTIAEMDAHSAPDIAAMAGVSTTGRTVREVIKSAREALAQNAQRYVQVHADVVETALANGDAKSLAVAASASQWAMERIAEGPDRVVDSPKQAGTLTQPSIQIGIALGGVRQSELPALPAVTELPDAIDIAPLPEDIDTP